MRVFVQGTGVAVELTQRQFLAQGGEAAVFVKGDVAYKVYHDPQKALPLGKVQALQVLTDPRIIRPLQLLVDAKGRPVGYTARYIRDAYALCQLFPRSFREREGVTPDRTRRLVEGLREAVAHVHAKGLLVVDLNEFNVLVARGFRDLYLIDTDSYEAPGYPCPVLMESVRDWSVQGNRWMPLSDWFSFAVVTFQMFVGVHPFKGQYTGPDQAYRSKLPADPPDDSFAVTRRRMRSNVSVFDPRVKVPAAAYSFDTIPDAYRAWYRDLFQAGKRALPPGQLGAVVVAVPRAVAPSTGALEVTEVARYAGTIRRVWSDGQRLVVVTDQGVWLDQARVPVDHPVHACGFSPRASRAVVVGRTDGAPQLTNLTDRRAVPFSLAADEVADYAGRVYLRAGEQVHELVLTDAGTQVLASTRAVVNVLPHATRLFSGVVVQNLLGAVYVSLLAAPGVARQVRVPKLDAYRLVEARFDGGVLMVLGAQNGRYDRLVFRFEEDAYDLRAVTDVMPMGLQFVVLDSGVCVSLAEDDKLEVFSAKRGSAAFKTVEDPVLGSVDLLAKHAGSLLLTRDNTLYRVRMR